MDDNMDRQSSKTATGPPHTKLAEDESSKSFQGPTFSATSGRDFTSEIVALGADAKMGQALTLVARDLPCDASQLKAVNDKEVIRGDVLLSTLSGKHITFVVGEMKKPGEVAPGIFSMSIDGEDSTKGYQPGGMSLDFILSFFKLSEDELMELRVHDGVEGVILCETVVGRMGSRWSLQWFPIGTEFHGTWFPIFSGTRARGITLREK
eukprot:gnl/TRDRNA2_/TRDRNA2_88531_c1_seq1.p1 gnl/TRDRNA2_/TRDRNA2_88531_c1~~gnl/TRDRNA2_/TRDRNA2_88531_c1_seq1.p1  ORF type:complete len:208 (+),score=30.20 gnl/TRDRNA2_/TRDRNA2_88531_c1_seq1:79-702(+)